MEGKGITLYLAGWQKRMVRDYIPNLREVHKIIINVIDKKEILKYRQIIVMYRPFIRAINEKAWNLYLTDEQIVHLKELTAGEVKFTAINITPELLESKAIEFA